MDDHIKMGFPPGVAISWGLERPSNRGPKRELSIDQIVDAAIAIADQDGLSSVSMNRVATSLGFTPMSLYRYIPSKDDLLILMQDAVCNIPNPIQDGDTDWRENLRKFYEATIGVYINHPWFGDIPISSIPITPNNLKMIDFALGGIRELPLNDHEKMAIILLISNYARGAGQIMSDANQAIQAGVSPSTFSGEDFSNALKQLVTSDRFPNLHSLVATGVYTDENKDDNIEDDFEFGLERILDGIENYLKKGKRADS